MGFLLAKDLLHVLLPDSKKASDANVNVAALIRHDGTFVSFCSLLPERDGERRGPVRVVPLSLGDQQGERRAWASCRSAAGGVGAVFGTADRAGGPKS